MNNTKTVDCITQHIHIFHEQAKYDEIADFGIVCTTCPHVKDCDKNFLSIIEPITSQSEIRINMLLE